MLTTIGNIHHHKLPKLGAIVHVNGLQSHGYNPRERWQVVAFPLCDNVQPYSRGIHTCHIRRLRDGRMARISGFYCID